MTRSTAHGRRLFLRGTAGAAIALPFLASFRAPGSKARAQDQTRPKRFLAYCQPLGTLGEAFWPKAPGEPPYQHAADEATCPESRNGPRCRAHTPRSGETFMDRSDWVASRILEPLDRHRDDLLIVENIDNSTGNHKGYAAMLTGWAPYNGDGRRYARGISLDQELANHIGQDTRFSSLQLGVQTSDVIGIRQTVSWYGEASGAPPEKSPQEVFRRVFSDVATAPEEMDSLRVQRRSILDAALGQAGRLRGRLGRDDQLRVDQYLESVRDVERRLAAVTPTLCTRPDEPSYSERDLDRNLELVPEITDVMLTLLADAYLCDLTRVATFQMSFEATNMTHPWLGVTGRWHDLSHNSASGDDWRGRLDQYLAISEWNALVLSQLIDKLKDRGLFDDTVVLWINPMNNGQIHNSNNIPIVVAGNAQGALRPGRHVRFAAGEHHVNDLHVTLLQALGVNASRFGDPELNHRPLTELLS